MRFRAPHAASAAVLPLIAVLAAGCTGPSPLAPAAGPVQGEGEVTAEDRTSGDFEHLSVGAGIRVEVTEGAPVSVTLAAQPNLLSLISTDVADGQLVVNVASPGISSSRPVTLTVVAPALESLSLSGGASGTMVTTAAALAIDVSGGAMLEATGSTRTLTLTVSGGGRANLGGLEADTATVTASGGGEAELTVLDELRGDVSAGATIRLTRQPASVDVTTSGGGMLIGG